MKIPRCSNAMAKLQQLHCSQTDLTCYFFTGEVYNKVWTVLVKRATTTSHKNNEKDKLLNRTLSVRNEARLLRNAAKNTNSKFCTLNLCIVFYTS